MTTPDPSNQGDQPPQKRVRRPRYGGTHPRDYAQKYKEHNLQTYPEMEAHLRAKGNTPAGTHIPILVEEVMECLRPAPGEIVVDCTLGYGGHASEFLKRIGPTGKLIGLDIDGSELERTGQRLAQQGASVSLHRSNFAGIAKVLKQENLAGVDVIFADLGVSSMQIDNPERGMSYKHEGPLDMRMDDRLQRTGADLLRTVSEQDLAKALEEFSDEPDAQKIARRIVELRAKRPVTQTSQLVQAVFDAKRLTPETWKQQRDRLGSLHPAARTFQALRILVNDEMSALKAFLQKAPLCLKPGGRIGVISFHSGEDRLVKHAFRDGYRSGVYESTAREVIVPGNKEIRENPRSASAIFRWAIARSAVAQ
ncbi:MAG: 16S rRNA (cytosine(1402)-N(4))-methyltransferase RsmH [Solirubrobacterales bacterium]